MPLPDLDETQISFIAFWNHLDNGASDIDPTEAESAMESSTQYSNGVDGLVSIGNGRSADCRVKDDGWILVWLDRSANYGSHIDSAGFTSPPDGPWDVVDNWGNEATNLTADQNELASGVKTLRDALSNSGASTFNFADVGLFDYASQAATNITMVTSSTGSGGGSVSHDITWDSDIDVYRWDGLGGTDSSGGQVTVNINGTRICDYDAGDRYAAVDVLARDLVTQGNTSNDDGSTNFFNNEDAVLVGAAISWG